MRNDKRYLVFRMTTTLLLITAIGTVQGQSTSNSPADWPMYRGDLAGTGYSMLDQISPDNVSQLSQSWRFSLTATTPANRAPNSQATPVVIDNRMYVPVADGVVALNPVTGEEIWRHLLSDGSPSRRGVAYWGGNSSTPPRILFTTGGQLLAIDTETGSAVTAFGDNGVVDLVIPYNSVPLIYDNIVVVGANTPPGEIGGVGNARAYDVRSGEPVWEFNSVPRPGETGHDTWAGDSWINRLGANAWPFYFTVDSERDLLFLPLASPIPFGYGGDRAGANLFANSIVAVNIYSGEYVWHFQTIHHDLWDHDPPAPPVLFDIANGQSTIPALAVSTKSGYLYILNRATGEPVYPVEEQPVPRSQVPGEESYPTQPIPAITAPMAKVRYQATDLVTASDTSSEHAAACAQRVAEIGEIYNEGPFSPWVFREDPTRGETTLLFPGLTGGPNWGGVAFDPASRLAFVFATNLGSFGWVEAAESTSEFPYQRSGPRPGNFDVSINGDRLPCQKPPWGQLTAVDTTTGSIAWQKPLGVTTSLPADRQETGRPGRAGALVTASGLLFIAATDDNRLRALIAENGEERWHSILSQRGNANPLTYMGADGKQYLVIAATDELVAFSLP